MLLPWGPYFENHWTSVFIPLQGFLHEGAGSGPWKIQSQLEVCILPNIQMIKITQMLAELLSSVQHTAIEGGHSLRGQLPSQQFILP